ncbi:hypothetical protein AAFF_G00254790 [Aldrovandia affinis]|uniref:LEM domain-containing protein n=1 Tax=Aldrovandia affinis TaxID=143900 RepID=A0AAD7RCR4_9TELE|nr:hypothetical protein AAFF_G00254790 [Aldrovandia affinis]
MPVFVEDPAQFSKQRLKSALVAHNVDLPAGESKKRVYLELYLKHVSTKRAADFSSDEEEQVTENHAEEPSVQEEEEEEKEEQQEEPDDMDVTQLTDDELKAQLLQYGVKAGPIVASTRALYEKKLQRLLDPVPQPKQNGMGEADQYSDSDEEEADESGSDCEHPGPEPVVVATTGSSHGQLSSSQVGTRSQEDENYRYPQCFLPSSRMRVRCEPASANHRTSGDEFDSVAKGTRVSVTRSGSAQSSSSSSASLPVGTRVVQQHRPVEGGRPALPPPSPPPSFTSTYIPGSFSITQMVEEGSVCLVTIAMGSAMESSSRGSCERKPPLLPDLVRQDTRRKDKCTMTNRSLLASSRVSLFKLQLKAPMTDVLTEMFPGENRPPTGISATRLRPIKGAAGRPVQFKYPDSPGAVERQELQRRLVPVWFQALVFLGVAGLIYLICNLSQGAELVEEPLPLPEPQDAPASCSLGRSNSSPSASLRGQGWGV